MTILALTQGEKLLRDGDTYTHIFLGSWMVEHLRLPNVDFLSHTVNGSPWVSHEWGAEVLMGLVHDHSGLGGIVILYAFLIGLTFTILFRVLEQLETDPWLSLVIIMAHMLLMFPMMHARPHIFTWLLASLTFMILYNRRRYVWVLPLLMVCWVNLHGGFILGIALQVVFIVGDILQQRSVLGWRKALERQANPGLVLILCLIATGANPEGYDILGFYFDVSASQVTDHNPEWQSPNLQTFLFLRLYLTLLLCGLLLRRIRPRWIHLFFLVVCLEAVLSHRRHVSLFAITLLPLWRELLLPLQEQFQVWRHRLSHHESLSFSSYSGPVLMTVLTVTLLITLPNLGSKWQHRLFPESKLFPGKAWEYIDTHQLSGKVFNAYSWGAFLIYHSHGRLPVFIDGFAHKYSQIYQDYYRIVELTKDTESLLAQYEINWILFPSQAPLVRYLLLTKNWQPLFQDKQATILQRSSSEGRSAASDENHNLSTEATFTEL